MLLLLSALLAGASPVQRQIPVAVVIAGPLPVSLEILRDEIGARTPLALRPAIELGVSQQHLAACESSEALLCWSRAVRGAASFLWLVRTRADQGVVAVLIPASAGVADDDPRIEDVLASGSIVLEDQAKGLEPWRAVGRRFGERLARREKQLRAGTGTLVVRAPAGGLEVALDDEPVGALGPAGMLRLEHVFAGAHRLALSDPKGALFHDFQLVDVATATVTTAFVTLRTRDTRVTTYGGLALAAAGAAIVAYGLAAPTNRELCFTPCEGSRFVTFGEGSGGTSPVMIVPLGYSLALTGLAWAASPSLIDETSAHPWLELGISLAIGAATYAVSAAAGG